MAEYIEREALMKRFCERCNEEMSESPFEPSDCFAREVIKTLPAADVAPVRHAIWIKHDDGVFTCSECGNAESNESYFCRYCGAKMDGGDGNSAMA